MFVFYEVKQKGTGETKHEHPGLRVGLSFCGLMVKLKPHVRHIQHAEEGKLTSHCYNLSTIHTMAVSQLE